MHACVRRDLRPRMQRDALVLPALFFLRFLFFFFFVSSASIQIPLYSTESVALLVSLSIVPRLEYRA